MSLIVTKILLGLASVLSTRPVDKTEYFKFQFDFAINNGISSDLQKLLRYFNSPAIADFSRMSFAASVLPTNLVLCSNNLKVSSSAISTLELVASSLEYNLPVGVPK